MLNLLLDFFIINPTHPKNPYVKGGGKAVLLAALSSVFDECLGVEINPDLWRISNIVKVGDSRRLESICPSPD